ncbi:MAG TPA: flagellar motor protein MotB [bacterium]|nr:flagellar motor protein MotB [bacterium]
MTTYSDMATLLMTFFIILATMLALKINPAWIAGKKFIQTDQADVEAPDNVPLVEVREADPDLIVKLEKLESPLLKELERVDELQKLGEEIKQYVVDQGLERFVRVEVSRWKVTIVPLAPFLFSPGKAVLRPQARELLDRLAAFFELNPYQVRIGGYTDSTPIHTPLYPSNWELSSARAAAVLRYFIDSHQVDPARFSAVGYGSQKPVASNETPEGRARNRRVEIEIVQRTAFSEGESSPADSSISGASE